VPDRLAGFSDGFELYIGKLPIKSKNELDTIFCRTVTRKTNVQLGIRMEEYPSVFVKPIRPFGI